MDKEKRIGIIISSDPSAKLVLSRALLALSLMEDKVEIIDEPLDISESPIHDNMPCQERNNIQYIMNFGRLTRCDPPYIGENKRDVYRKPLNKGRRR